MIIGKSRGRWSHESGQQHGGKGERYATLGFKKDTTEGGGGEGNTRHDGVGGNKGKRLYRGIWT